MAYQPLYTATATAHGGRTGRVHSDDGLIDMQLAMPTSVGGPGGKGTNPEQLFAAGYSACFESALRLVARTQKKPLQDATITAQVTLGKTDDGGFGLSVELHGKLSGVEQPVAQALMEAAHQVCPYSRATKGNIPVKLVAD
ncbi:MAG: organic hydroperoxide resistance protein [Myxococcaceae bacterium]